ncbi:MAG: SIS domain-containing protein [Bacteriovoracaceae bacterium]|nr:SIS domain-containing protein [Bacteriovoracaceae bacterium]
MKPFMVQEISEIPEILESKISQWKKYYEMFNTELSKKKDIYLLGRGSSGNASILASYMLGVKLGRQPVEFRLWTSTQSNVGESDLSDVLVLAYSQSGSSSDIAYAAKWLKDRGASVVVVSNSDDSKRALLQHADRNFYLDVGDEKAVPATKTFIGQLAVTMILSGEDLTQISEVTTCMKKILSSQDKVAQIADDILKAEEVLWMGRGIIMAAALDNALKFQEAAFVRSQAYSPAEYLHGPIASLQKGSLVILLAPELEQDQTIIDRVNQTAKQKLASCYSLVDNTPWQDLMPKQEWGKTLVFALLGELLAYNVAIKKGIDPDAPQGLKKVTLT